jgi:hypothetical protein
MRQQVLSVWRFMNARVCSRKRKVRVVDHLHLGVARMAGSSTEPVPLSGRAPPLLERLVRENWDWLAPYYLSALPRSRVN